MKYEMKRKGFTLIELVIIIALFGILAAILLPLLQKMNWSKEKDLPGPITFYVEEKSYSYRVGIELKLKNPEKKQKVDMAKLQEQIEKSISLVVKEAFEAKTDEENKQSPAKTEKPVG